MVTVSNEHNQRGCTVHNLLQVESCGNIAGTHDARILLILII